MDTRFGQKDFTQDVHHFNRNGGGFWCVDAEGCVRVRRIRVKGGADSAAFSAVNALGIRDGCFAVGVFGDDAVVADTEGGVVGVYIIVWCGGIACGFEVREGLPVVLSRCRAFDAESGNVLFGCRCPRQLVFIARCFGDETHQFNGNDRLRFCDEKLRKACCLRRT